MKVVLVTGGAGFIGSNFVIHCICHEYAKVINLDKLTYAGNLSNIKSIYDHPSHVFVHGDIANRSLVTSVLDRHHPNAIINFAAESHVDRSIHDPEKFIQTNIVGTQRLLDASLEYWRHLNDREKEEFRILHVSTDEVYGSLGPHDPPFTESSPYRPNSPYAASKAAADHLVRAYHHTYGLPVLTTNCSNNYGPYQFPEKLIPLMILNAIKGERLPIYGTGQNIRDWLYVVDHCEALKCVLESGRPGETYNIGCNSERTNIEVVNLLCDILDEMLPQSPYRPHSQLIEFVTDRPGHDLRYAIDATKIRTELGWEPRWKFEEGLRETVKWYLDNMQWVDSVISGEYRQWMALNYENR